MPRLAHEYMRHILDEAEYLIEHSRPVNQAGFLEDATLRRAFVRSIKVIGEVAKHRGVPMSIVNWADQRSIRSF